VTDLVRRMLLIAKYRTEASAKGTIHISVRKLRDVRIPVVFMLSLLRITIPSYRAKITRKISLTPNSEERRVELYGNLASLYRASGVLM
jgi:hypothetical protein